MHDIFKKKLPVYSFENICHEDSSLKLNDRTFKLFFNAESCDKLKSTEEKDFFNFLKGNSAQTELSKDIQEKVFLAKKNKSWRRQYMTWQQTIDEEKEIAREEGLAEGKAEGSREARLEAARNALKLNLTPEQIAQITGLSIEEIQKL